MKKYYKVFIILLLIFFIIPQIVSASWWNPFSWSIWNNIFHKTATKTQTLENLANPIPETTDKTTANPIQQSPPITTPKAQDQTTQYKKLIMGKVINEFALAKTYSDFASKVIPTIDGRINTLNDLISHNNSIANSMSSGVVKDYTIYISNYFNNMYASDNKYSSSVKAVLANNPDYYKLQTDNLNNIAIWVSGANSISTEDFEKNNNQLDVINGNISDWFSKENGVITDWKNTVVGFDASYQDKLMTLKAENASYFSSVSNNSATQININYNPPYIPPIQYVSPKNCYFQWYGTSGSMVCD